MILGLLVALLASAASPAVTIVPKGSGYLATAAPFAATDSITVDAEMDRRASELCTGRMVRWGKFGSNATISKNAVEVPKVTGYFKEFSCVIEQPRNGVAAPADWQPSPADDADVRSFFGRYYAKRDSGDFAAALAMFDPAQDLSLEADQQREFNAKLGSGRRRITNVTWYVNPEGAKQPGVYAALDFVGDYPSMHFYCGYLVLYRLAPGSYEITREEQNSFERAHEAPDPVQLAAMKAAACRD